MRANLDNVAAETLAQELINETEDLNRLNLAKQNQRAAFLQAISKRPKLLQNIKDFNATHFLTVALNADYTYFTYLKREQYTDELAQIFLAKRLEKRDPAEKNEKLSVQKSLDNKILFNYTYLTPEGEELYYLDNELEVPSSLRSSLKISFKLIDAVALIDKIDIHITQLGERKICSTLTDLVSSSFRAYLNEYIFENKIGYYTLCSSFAKVEKYLKEKMNESFKEYGLEIGEFIIKKLAIPTDIQYKLEDQAFEIRRRRADVESNNEFAIKSLGFYEKKLEIQEKYPNAEHSLTEFEKDLALQRYLIKTGKDSKEEVDHTIEIKQKVEKKDAVISQTEDIVPEVPDKKNVFKIAYFTLLGMFVFVSLLCFIAGVGVGLIMLGVTTLIFGGIAAFYHNKFKKEKVEPNIAETNGNESNDVQ